MILPDIINSLSVKFGMTVSEDSDFKDRFAARINNLIVTDFPALVQILYRLDISEQKLKQMLASHPGTDAGLIIADLLIEREIQKARTRTQFKQDENIPDDEKW